MAQIRLADLARGQTQERQDPLFAGSFEAESVEIKKRQRRREGNALVSVHEAVVPRKPVGVARGQVEKADLLFSVDEEVLGPRQGGFQEIPVPNAIGPSVLRDQGAMHGDDDLREQPLGLGLHLASSRSTSRFSRRMRSAASICRENASSYGVI